MVEICVSPLTHFIRQLDVNVILYWTNLGEALIFSLDGLMWTISRYS